MAVPVYIRVLWVLFSVFPSFFGTETRPPSVLVQVFGSAASGFGDAGSDLDLTVEVALEVPAQLLRPRDALRDASILILVQEQPEDRKSTFLDSGLKISCAGHGPPQLVF